MFYHKSCFCNKNIFVQISFCGNLFVFSKIFVSPAFSEKVCLYHIFFVHLQLFFAKISFENLFSEKKLLFISSWFFLFEESLFYFSIAFLNFCLRLLCFSFLLFSVRFSGDFIFQFVQSKKNLLKNLSRKYGCLKFLFMNFFVSESTLNKKEEE